MGRLHKHGAERAEMGAANAQSDDSWLYVMTMGSALRRWGLSRRDRKRHLCVFNCFFPLLYAAASMPPRRRLQSSVGARRVHGGVGERVPPRWDVPVRRCYMRGSRNKVAQVLSSSGGIANAIKDARRERYAATTVGPERERRKLIRWILRRAMGTPFLPLTEGSLEFITGVLRKAGYRSTAAFLSEAKDMNVAEGHSWSEHLAR